MKDKGNVKNFESMSEKERLGWLDEHFYYEICCFEEAFSCMKAKNEINPQIKINKELELFLLHVRCLSEFFYEKTKDKYPNDARAEHFFKNSPEWENLRPDKDGLWKNIEKDIDRAGKELFHLTYARIAGIDPEKLWKISEIYSELKKVITIFINTIPKKYLGKNLIGFKQRLTNNNDLIQN